MSDEPQRFNNTVMLGTVIYDPLDRLNETISMLRKHNKGIYRDVCQALRIAITGYTISPPIFEVMEILGKEECMKRLAIYE